MNNTINQFSDKFDKNNLNARLLINKLLNRVQEVTVDSIQVFVKKCFDHHREVSITF